MINVTYCCDRCKAIQDNPEQFWEVGITTKAVGNTSLFSSPVKKIQLCRLCIEYFGFAPYVKTPKEQQLPPPTIDEIIQDIVANAVAEYSNGR